jgi:hypothetical protein
MQLSANTRHEGESYGPCESLLFPHFPPFCAYMGVSFSFTLYKYVKHLARRTGTCCFQSLFFLPNALISSRRLQTFLIFQ